MSYQNRFYLTGSINQPTVADAFAFVGKRLQPGVTRVPDGEPGDRAIRARQRRPAVKIAQHGRSRRRRRIDDKHLRRQYRAYSGGERRKSEPGKKRTC